MGELLSLNQVNINLGILAGLYIFSKENFFTHKGPPFVEYPTLYFC
ncbi:protein of unknown function [Streptococcus thermophilus]|nr:protein of unknown function [Streptococcus thermophilus]